MRLFRISFLTAILSLLVSCIYAQTGKPTTGSVSGKLVDGDNNPVSYATVTLLKMDSAVVNGALSSDDGTFNITPTGTGNFLLRIESMGLSKKIITVQITDSDPDKKLGKIKLGEADHKLGEVSVVGEKAMMEMKVDKKVFNVEKNTTTAGGSATDVLQNVPAVSVDADGNVALRGKSGVTILIDGKPATLLGSDVASALQSLPANSIESVEVITNPSAKYDAQGTSGIINIVTKKDGRFGMNGNVTLGAGTNGKYNANLGLNARKGKWNVFMNSSLRLNSSYNNVSTHRIDKDSTRNAKNNQSYLQSYYTYEHVPRHFDGFFNTVGASFDPDKYNSITITENINSMTFGFKDYSDYYVFNDPAYDFNNTSFHQNRYTDFSVGILSLSSSLNYKHKFKKKDEELTFDATVANSDLTRKQEFVTFVTPDTNKFNTTLEHSPAKGANSTVTISSDYTDPMFTKNGKLGLGFKSQFYNYNNTNDPVVSHAGGPESMDYNLLSRYNYSQQVHAGYVNWNDQVGKFGYQVGLRFEDVIYDGQGKLAGDSAAFTKPDTTFHSTFGDFFPSAFISYQLREQESIYLNYSRRTNRPGFMQLLPFIDLSNPGTINTGNPGLIPEFINNVEFSYSRSDKKGNNFILSAYYANTKNLIEKITANVDSVTAKKYNVAPTTLISKPVNIASGTTYGLEGTGHFQFLPIWDATVNLNFFQNQLQVGNADPSLKNNSGLVWFSKINTNLKLPKNFSFQVNANYESPKVITQGTLKETYWIDVALKKNFLKNKATLVLNCSDIFNTHSTVTNYDLLRYSEIINRVKETRIFNINFTYRFGKSDLGKNGGKGGKPEKAMEKKNKPEKPSDEDREKNMKEGDDNDQGGGGGGERGGKKEGKGGGTTH